MKVFNVLVDLKLTIVNNKDTDTYPGLPQTTKMKHFTITVNAFGR